MLDGFLSVMEAACFPSKADHAPLHPSFQRRPLLRHPSSYGCRGMGAKRGIAGGRGAGLELPR